MQQSVRNVCAKFKTDHLSCFHTGVCHVPTTKKCFPSKIHLTMKIATSNSLWTFSDQIIICQISFRNLWCQINLFSSEKVNICSPSGCFPFLLYFSFWNETNTKSSIKKKDMRKMKNCKVDNIAEKLFRSGNMVSHHYARNVIKVCGC